MSMYIDGPSSSSSSSSADLRKRRRHSVDGFVRVPEDYFVLHKPSSRSVEMSQSVDLAPAPTSSSLVRLFNCYLHPNVAVRAVLNDSDLFWFLNVSNPRTSLVSAAESIFRNSELVKSSKYLLQSVFSEVKTMPIEDFFDWVVRHEQCFRNEEIRKFVITFHTQETRYSKECDRYRLGLFKIVEFVFQIIPLLDNSRASEYILKGDLLLDAREAVWPIMARYADRLLRNDERDDAVLTCIATLVATAYRKQHVHNKSNADASLRYEWIEEMLEVAVRYLDVMTSANQDLIRNLLESANMSFEDSLKYVQIHGKEFQNQNAETLLCILLNSSFLTLADVSAFMLKHQLLSSEKKYVDAVRSFLNFLQWLHMSNVQVCLDRFYGRLFYMNDLLPLLGQYSEIFGFEHIIDFLKQNVSPKDLFSADRIIEFRAIFAKAQAFKRYFTTPQSPALITAIIQRYPTISDADISRLFDRYQSVLTKPEFVAFMTHAWTQNTDMQLEELLELVKQHENMLSSKIHRSYLTDKLYMPAASAQLPALLETLSALHSGEVDRLGAISHLNPGGDVRVEFELYQKIPANWVFKLLKHDLQSGKIASLSDPLRILLQFDRVLSNSYWLNFIASYKSANHAVSLQEILSTLDTFLQDCDPNIRGMGTLAFSLQLYFQNRQTEQLESVLQFLRPYCRLSVGRQNFFNDFQNFICRTNLRSKTTLEEAMFEYFLEKRYRQYIEKMPHELPENVKTLFKQYRAVLTVMNENFFTVMLNNLAHHKTQNLAKILDVMQEVFKDDDLCHYLYGSLCDEFYREIAPITFEEHLKKARARCIP